MAGVVGRKELGNVEVRLKVMPWHLSKRKEKYDAGNRDMNVHYQTVEKSFGKVGHG